MSFRLKQAGFEIETFTSAKSGLQKIQESVPDLLMLDIMMPDMSGYEVAQEIDKIDKAKSMPIIFLTGKLDYEQEKIPKRSNIAFFIKPCEFNELTAKINEML